jgi:hypothetical protein
VAKVKFPPAQIFRRRRSKESRDNGERCRLLLFLVWKENNKIKSPGFIIKRPSLVEHILFQLKLAKAHQLFGAVTLISMSKAEIENFT